MKHKNKKNQTKSKPNKEILEITEKLVRDVQEFKLEKIKSGEWEQYLYPDQTGDTK